MSFKTYIPNKRSTTKEPEVLLSKNANITLNPAAVGLGLENHTHVQLLFDPESKKIAIKPVDERDEHSLKTRTPARSQSRMISGRGFLEYCSIEVDHSVRRPALWDASVAAVVVSVDGLIAPSGSSATTSP